MASENMLQYFSPTKGKDPKECNFFEDCNSVLCPLDKLMIEKIWIPEENELGDVCRNPEFKELPFIKNQSKIGKTVKRTVQEREDFFTYEMLNRKITVGSRIKGIPLDPPDLIRDTASWYQEKQERWIKDHPERKPLSKEEIEIRQSRMREIRGRVKA